MPFVAVSKETRILDDPSKASGDRLQTPGARLPETVAKSHPMSRARKAKPGIGRLVAQGPTIR